MCGKLLLSIYQHLIKKLTKGYGLSNYRPIKAIMKNAEKVMEGPVEIEWALDTVGFKALQARPLHLGPVSVPDELWLQHPSLRGQPGGIGWGTGRACVIS